MNFDFNFNFNEELIQCLFLFDKELLEENEIESVKIFEVVYCFRKVSYEMIIKFFSMVKWVYLW